jgi:hypothetical protein
LKGDVQARVQRPGLAGMHQHGQAGVERGQRDEDNVNANQQEGREQF